MINRLWINIPPQHELVFRVKKKGGTNNFSVVAVYDPQGPPIDPQWNHSDLTDSGPQLRSVDGNATVHFDTAYFGSTPITIEVTAFVRHRVTKIRYANVDGKKILRESFSGKAGDFTRLQYFLYI